MIMFSTTMLNLIGIAIASPLAQFGRFMYWFATIALLIAGLSFLTIYWFKHRRYYRKGLLSLQTTLVTLLVGLFLFALGIIMLIY